MILRLHCDAACVRIIFICKLHYIHQDLKSIQVFYGFCGLCIMQTLLCTLLWDIWLSFCLLRVYTYEHTAILWSIALTLCKMLQVNPLCRQGCEHRHKNYSLWWICMFSGSWWSWGEWVAYYTQPQTQRLKTVVYTCMYMPVCLCVYICLGDFVGIFYICTCMCSYVYITVCTDMCECTCVCLHACVCVYIHLYVCGNMYCFCSSICVHVGIYVSMCVHIRLCIYAYIHVWMHMWYVCLCACMYALYSVDICMFMCVCMYVCLVCMCARMCQAYVLMWLSIHAKARGQCWRLLPHFLRHTSFCFEVRSFT